MPPVVSRILVPVDFSPCSRAALEYALELAEGMGAQIDVLHVSEPSAFIGADALMLIPDASRAGALGESRDDLLHELDGFLGSARARVRRVRLEPGLPADVIPSVAKDGGYDLVVMGTHGRSGLSRLVVGSVAEAAMRRSPVPVLTLRLPRHEPRERVPL
jgi:nucleotide-binding universal stress UspA family protein